MLTLFVVYCFRLRTMKENTTKPLSLRFSPAVRKTMKTLSEESGITQAQLFDVVMRAGCDAIARNNHKISLPLKFEIAD